MTKQVVILFGQDTPAYATATVEIPEGADPLQYVKDNSGDILDDVEFEPSYDWDGLRIVEMRCGSEVLVNDEPVGRMPYYDIGLLAVGAIKEHWEELANANASGAISDELLLKFNDLLKGK